MRDFVIMTDSCCDLTDQMARELELEVVPLSLHMGEHLYQNWLDGRDIGFEDFYARIRAGEMATTSAVSVGEFEAVMRPILAQGKDILYIGFSSALSTTYQSAVIAADDLRAEFPDARIFVVDSLCASLGQGLLVYLAAKLREQGRSIEEVRDWAEENKLHMCHQFTVDDLHFLKRGGRISATTAVVGSMLQIKPVLHVDNEGHLINIAKARGRQASLKALVDKMEKTVTDPTGQVVFISHGDCREDAQTVEKMVKERLGVKEVYINYVGPVIGAHSGPGTLALFYVGSER